MDAMSLEKQSVITKDRSGWPAFVYAVTMSQNQLLAKQKKMFIKREKIQCSLHDKVWPWFMLLSEILERKKTKQGCF